MARKLSEDRVAKPFACLLLLTAMLAGGCSSPTASVPKTSAPHLDARYLLSPLTGYPLSLSASEAEALRVAHHGLLAGEEAAVSAEVAAILLEGNPELEPAQLLFAQSDLVGGRYSAALDRAGPIADRHPDYLAAQLVAARAAEKLEDIKGAFAAYLRAGKRSDLARNRARELYPRATRIAANRCEELIGRGRLAEAGVELDLLESWAPDELRTVQLIADYSAVAETPSRELTAVRRLIEFGSSNELLLRRARLEMVAGDAGQGLRILEELTEQEPANTVLALELDRAKFRWRLDLLPAEVGTLLALPELTRADYAKLLFWLFPDVRYGRPSHGRIASDILDHTHRQEIARVINLDLMKVDRTLHLFHPERVLKREDGLESVLKILSQRTPRPACLGSTDPGVQMSVETLCQVAARCGLLPEPGDCLPEGSASGRFVEAIGFAALDVLGVE